MRMESSEVVMVARGASPAHRWLRSRLLGVVMLTAIVDLAASCAILVLERHAPGTGIKTIGDALFWTTTQLLTVSSQLPNPITAPARVIDVALQAYAVSVVAVLAGSFGAFFHHRGMHPPT